MVAGIDELAAGTQQLADGAAQLKGDEKSGLTLASNAANQLSDGLAELKAKIPALLEGINQVSSGADQLADGSGQLASNLDKYSDAIGKLASGTDSAASGTGTLRSGLETFADEGIGAITDKIDNDLLPFTDRLDAITQAGKDYNNFAGITKGTKGNVKFIIETDPIEKADE